MNPTIASVVFAAGIGLLIYLDRDRSLRTSPALWLPVLWLLIIGSRPVSVWLGASSDNLTVAESAEGSPLDAAVFAALGVVGVVVLLRRSRRIRACLKANWPILLFFGYCLCSVLWSDFPAIAFKRWIKAVSELVMVLVIATESDPVAAFDRLIFRVAVLLMPCSVLFIRYFGTLGRGYDPDGMAMNVGVTTNKNTLGVITLVLALGCVWRFMMTWTHRQRNRGRMLVARGTLLLFCVAVLRMAQSATSIACFALGAIIIASTFIPAVKRKKSAIHWLTGTVLICGSLIVLLGSSSLVIHALGRKSNFTGRTLIWEAVIPVVPNALLGAGFESFWLGPRLAEVYSHLSKYMHVNEAHNGYIEAYLNLGCVGVALIVGILLHGYAGAVAAFRRNGAFGGMALAYVISAAIYSVTEAGFRMLDPIWVFLLLAGAISYEVAFVAARKAAPIVNSVGPAARNPISTGWGVHHARVSSPHPMIGRSLNSDSNKSA